MGVERTAGVEGADDRWDGEGGDGVGERVVTPEACKAAGGGGGGSVAGA
jgi:hypothetical protein